MHSRSHFKNTLLLALVFFFFLICGVGISLYFVDPAFAVESEYQCASDASLDLLDVRVDEETMINKLIALLKYFIQLSINVYCAMVKALGFHCG